MRSIVTDDRFGLMLDFDGTIAAITPTPAEAAISPAAAESIRWLVSRLALVCVISGRAVGELRDRVGIDGVSYVGNHGAEYLYRGNMAIAEGAGQYVHKIGHVLGHLKAVADAPGLYWDDKRYSASVHYRLSKDPAATERVLTNALRSAPGADSLDVFWGKMVLEIRAPLGLDKGYAVRKLVRDHRLDAAMVLGDDTTDVDAMVAVRELRAGGRLVGAGVAVLHADSPGEILRSADYGLAGVEEVDIFLEWLIGATR